LMQQGRHDERPGQIGCPVPTPNGLFENWHPHQDRHDRGPHAYGIEEARKAMMIVGGVTCQRPILGHGSIR
jgi:hypothetical protein